MLVLLNIVYAKACFVHLFYVISFIYLTKIQARRHWGLGIGGGFNFHFLPTSDVERQICGPMFNRIHMGLGKLWKLEMPCFPLRKIPGATSVLESLLRHTLKASGCTSGDATDFDRFIDRFAAFEYFPGVVYRTVQYPFRLWRHIVISKLLCNQTAT